MLPAGVNPIELPSYLQSARVKVNELFLHWLSLPETQDAVRRVLAVGVAAKHVDTSKAELLEVGDHSQSREQPPRSPTTQRPKSQTSPLFSDRKQPGLSSSRIQPTPSQKSTASVPRFFFRQGPPPDSESLAEEERKVAQFWSKRTQLKRAEMEQVCRSLLNLPGFFAGPLFSYLTKKSATTGQGVSSRAFFSFWDSLKAFQKPARMFRVLILAGAHGSDEKAVVNGDPDAHPYVQREHFLPFLNALLERHPGLDFLKATPEFQSRWKETVLIRILYKVDIDRDGKLSYREFERSDLLTSMFAVDDTEDINAVLNYFSYEHFYVLYCKFWELDQDHDFRIGKEDLVRYGNYSLTTRIVDRIFEGRARPLQYPQSGQMGYEDFVWFCMSEEDKTTDSAIEYWFRCVDSDGDGVISLFEMEELYQEQLERMESSGQEVVPLVDIVCQLVDMVHSRLDNVFTLKELKRCKLVSVFWNVLFNLNKFIAYEQRDPFVAHQESLAPEKTDWDRFARYEYDRMAMEDEQDQNSDEFYNDQNYAF